MEIQSILARKSLEEEELREKLVIDVHRCTAPRIHRRHPKRRTVDQSRPPFKRLSLIHAKRPPQSGFVLTGKREVMPSEHPSRNVGWVDPYKQTCRY